MRTNRLPLLLRVIAGVLLLTISGWCLFEGNRANVSVAGTPGARETLMLGGVTLAPIAAPLFNTLLANGRD